MESIFSLAIAITLLIMVSALFILIQGSFHVLEESGYSIEIEMGIGSFYLLSFINTMSPLLQSLKHLSMKPLCCRVKMLHSSNQLQLMQ
jgi:hypothetical protein